MSHVPPGPAGEATEGTPSGPVGGPTVRVASFVVLVLAFLLLAGAAAAAAYGQFKAGETGPVVSIGLSAGAVILTGIALWLRPMR